MVMAADLRKYCSEDDLPTAPWRFFLSFIPFLVPLASSGVARNFERGFPNDRVGGLGAQPPQERGVRGHRPRKNFEFYTENACKNSVYKHRYNTRNWIGN